MNREEALELISRLPVGTDIYVRAGQFMDDAYPAKLRVFNGGDGLVAYFESNYEGDHRNWPEGYNGVTEVFPVEDVVGEEVRTDEGGAGIIQEILSTIEGFRLQRRHEVQIDRYYGERERKNKLYAGAGCLCYCDICVKEHAEVYG